ncbi:SDR family oxidoreductase [Wukongibacter sp. M2B1]|uniref:type I polyketide synthase n=1 Tax=Wukongibacter sp. M2B1 TaxID=3088895 RepID=UPI003D7960C5
MKKLVDFDLEQLDEIKDEDILDVEKISRNDIAIIGMSIRFPKADDVDTFWKNVENGVDCIRELSHHRLIDIKDYMNYLNRDIDDKDFEEAAYLDKIDEFDYSYFQISPKEASLMDINQRLFLETAIGAIEDSGYGGERLMGSRTGVYVGFGVESQYKELIEDVAPELISMSVSGNLSPLIASRISYFMNLKGPSMLVNTACSSSLVALHAACQSIIDGECDMAIAGGTQTYVLPIRKAKIGIEASDNRAKTFDYDADGTGGGEGVAAVILKPLSRAINDGDNIYAVIKGSAVNNDGRSNGITAPNAIAQEDVILRAWEKARINPETITYIEAHGTGTKLGDPIEVDGLSRAFRRFTDKRQFCGIGSVKTNIGHLDNSAGIAGVIKAALMLKNKKIPPTLNFSRPNSQISFEKSPLYVCDELQNWETDGFPRRCGISSFGLSGTNCHLVLEEYNSNAVRKQDIKSNNYVLLMSSKNKSSLMNMIKAYKALLKKKEEVNLGDLCFTANTGRGHYNYRLAIIFKNKNDLINTFEYIEEGSIENIEFENVFYNMHKVVAKEENKHEPNDISEMEKKEISKMANQRLEEYIISKEEKFEALVHLCNEYVRGGDVEWNELYKGKSYKRISIPTYPFERKRCWVDIPKSCVRNLTDDNDFYTLIEWEEEELKNTKRIDRQGTVLFFKVSGARADELVSIYRQNGHSIIEVEAGKAFEKINALRFLIGESQEDYIKLLEEINLNEITEIVHAMTISDVEEIRGISQLKETQSKGVCSLFYLTRALIDYELEKYPNITLITEYMNEVSSKEKIIRPENAMLSGLIKAINWEYPYFNVKLIDIDEKSETEAVFKEIGTDTKELQVAYRENKRYVEVVKEGYALEANQDSVEVKKNGVYVITGGVGRIGLEIGKYLASQNRIKLALINRSEIPDCSQWNEIIEKSEDEILKSKIKEIIDIKSTGASVHLYSGDVSVENQMQAVFSKIRNDFGGIDGVIHCAGVGVGMEGNILGDEKEDIFKAVLRPKVEGTWVIDNITRQDKLDFFIMCSSVITMIGGVGSGCYIAANAYLDSYASYRSALGYKTTTINWPAWDKYGLIQSANIIESKQLVKAISPQNAILAFEKILNTPLRRVVVGQLNYEGELFEMHEYLPFKLSDEIKEKIEKTRDHNKKSNTGTKPIKLRGKDTQEYSRIEEQIAMIWQEVLGFEELSIHDNFFEIGGDSIMTTKVHSLMKDRLEEDIKVVDLFAYPTIATLAEYLLSKYDSSQKTFCEKEEETLDIINLLDNMEKGSISLEDAMNTYILMEE